MDMCRFIGLEDAEYKKVDAAFRRIAATVSTHQGKCRGPTLSEKQKRALLDSLRFDQIDSR